MRDILSSSNNSISAIFFMFYPRIWLRFNWVFTASAENIVALQQALLLDDARRFTIGSYCTANCILVNKKMQKDIKYITAPARTSLLSGNLSMSILYARQRFCHMCDAEENMKYDYNPTCHINWSVYYNLSSSYY